MLSLWPNKRDEDEDDTVSEPELAWLMPGVVSTDDGRYHNDISPPFTGGVQIPPCLRS